MFPGIRLLWVMICILVFVPRGVNATWVCNDNLSTYGTKEDCLNNCSSDTQCVYEPMNYNPATEIFCNKRCYDVRTDLAQPYDWKSTEGTKTIQVSIKKGIGGSGIIRPYGNGCFVQGKLSLCISGNSLTLKFIYPDGTEKSVTTGIRQKFWNVFAFSVNPNTISLFVAQVGTGNMPYQYLDLGYKPIDRDQPDFTYTFPITFVPLGGDPYAAFSVHLGRGNLHAGNIPFCSEQMARCNLNWGFTAAYLESTGLYFGGMLGDVQGEHHGMSAYFRNHVYESLHNYGDMFLSEYPYYWRGSVSQAWKADFGYTFGFTQWKTENDIHEEYGLQFRYPALSPKLIGLLRTFSDALPGLKKGYASNRQPSFLDYDWDFYTFWQDVAPQNPCPAGQVTTNDGCFENFASLCPQGQVELDSYRGTCFQYIEQAGCWKGEPQDQIGNQCYIDQGYPDVCPSGSTLVGSGPYQCRFDQDPFTDPYCPWPQIAYQGECYNKSVPQCSTGCTRDGGTCTCTETQPACPNGYTYDAANDRCLQATDTTPSCPAGTYNINGQCWYAQQPSCTSNGCPFGYNYDYFGSGTCSALGLPCINGYACWKVKNGTCTGDSATTITYNGTDYCAASPGFTTGNCCQNGYDLYFDDGTACTTYGLPCDSGYRVCGQYVGVAACDSGQVEINGECYNVAAPSCPSGWSRNGDTCSYTYTESACPSGYFYSIEPTEACYQNQGWACNPGYSFNPGRNLCEKFVEPSCAIGSKKTDPDTGDTKCFTLDTTIGSPPGHIYCRNGLTYWNYGGKEGCYEQKAPTCNGQGIIPQGVIIGTKNQYGEWTGACYEKTQDICPAGTLPLRGEHVQEYHCLKPVKHFDEIYYPTSCMFSKDMCNWMKKRVTGSSGCVPVWGPNSCNYAFTDPLQPTNEAYEMKCPLDESSVCTILAGNLAMCGIKKNCSSCSDNLGSNLDTGIIRRIVYADNHAYGRSWTTMTLDAASNTATGLNGRLPTSAEINSIRNAFNQSFNFWTSDETPSDPSDNRPLVVVWDDPNDATGFFAECIYDDLGAGLCTADMTRCENGVCPYGSNIPCQPLGGVLYCSRYSSRCESLANPANNWVFNSPDITAEDKQNDAPVSEDGTCMGTVYIMNGEASECKTSGVDSHFRNCCDADDDLVEAYSAMSDKLWAIKGTLSSLKQAYTVGKSAIDLYNIATSDPTGAAFDMYASGYSEAVQDAVLDTVAAGGSSVDAASSAIMNSISLTSIGTAIVTHFVMNYLLSSGCDAEDMETAALNALGNCHYVGKYCSKKVFGMCLQEKKVYCCFNSKLGRVLHEQGRPQLKSFDGWGDAELPLCRGFTADEFSMLDFSNIDLSEVYEDIQTRAQSEIKTQAQNATSTYIDNYFSNTFAHGNNPECATGETLYDGKCIPEDMARCLESGGTWMYSRCVTETVGGGGGN